MRLARRERQNATHGGDAQGEHNLKRAFHVKIETLKFANPLQQFAIVQVTDHMDVQGRAERVRERSGCKRSRRH